MSLIKVKYVYCGNSYSYYKPYTRMNFDAKYNSGASSLVNRKDIINMIDIDIQKINFLKQLNIKHWKEIFMDKVTNLLSINNNDLEKLLLYWHVFILI